MVVETSASWSQYHTTGSNPNCWNHDSLCAKNASVKSRRRHQISSVYSIIYINSLIIILAKSYVMKSSSKKFFLIYVVKMCTSVISCINLIKQVEVLLTVPGLLWIKASLKISHISVCLAALQQFFHAALLMSCNHF